MSTYLPSVETEPAAVEPSAVAWGAVLAGAMAAAALSLILLILGTGLGLSAVSPWAPRGISASGFGVAAIAWITLTQLVASGMGGYLAGRLRTKWRAVHTDEVYFRDTAHGFLAWAVATLVTAAVLASATGAIVGGGLQAGAAVVGTAATGVSGAVGMAVAGAEKSDTSGSDMNSYFVDALFRKDTPAASAAASTSTAASTSDSLSSTSIASASSAAPAAEITRIFINSLRAGGMPPEDVRYVGQQVAQRTGLAQADAEKRVSASFSRLQTKLKETEAAAKDTADKARKASAYAALWILISLLAGAFFASLAATFGGRQRDVEMPAATYFRPVN